MTTKVASPHLSRKGKPGGKEQGWYRYVTRSAVDLSGGNGHPGTTNPTERGPSLPGAGDTPVALVGSLREHVLGKGHARLVADHVGRKSKALQ